MICLSGFIGLLLVLTAEARVGNSSLLEFCRETEQCLLFDLICKTPKYEVRHYDSVKWVSTDYTTFSMELMMVPSFWRLYGYITGENEKGQKINMTAPVLMKIPEKSIFKRDVYTMSFLLPEEYQMNPPKPTNNAVYIQEMPAMNVYVLSHGEMMHTFSDNKYSKELSTALDTARAQYRKGFHYTAGYDSPKPKKNRHSEVWYVVEGDPVCFGSE
ncbi:heme-binding protein 2-like [Girardinichthys multiradiatus]|uniref:heme-binding protein 2-like n=1 Tax=Girardinichthys multiradiatus TaxID=208333 RepID=UPI001FAE5F8A|nr:heme-binding protein 2-like [Girardinichthys multiradiatus]